MNIQLIVCLALIVIIGFPAMCLFLDLTSNWTHSVVFELFRLVFRRDKKALKRIREATKQEKTSESDKAIMFALALLDFTLMIPVFFTMNLLWYFMLFWSAGAFVAFCRACWVWYKVGSYGSMMHCNVWKYLPTLYIRDKTWYWTDLQQNIVYAVIWPLCLVKEVLHKFNPKRYTAP